eukprot:2089305-Ditylum_brightwellii.AAC.1
MMSTPQKHTSNSTLHSDDMFSKDDDATFKSASRDHEKDTSMFTPCIENNSHTIIQQTGDCTNISNYQLNSLIMIFLQYTEYIQFLGTKGMSFGAIATSVEALSPMPPKNK